MLSLDRAAKALGAVDNHTRRTSATKSCGEWCGSVKAREEDGREEANPPDDAVEAA